MTKKKEIKKSKLNKWMKILLWILGIVLGIFSISVIGFKIWMFTWLTYRSDEFTIKYPSQMKSEELDKYFISEIDFDNIRRKLLISDLIEYDKLKNYNLGRSGEMSLTIYKYLGSEQEKYDISTLGKSLFDDLNKLKINTKMKSLVVSGRTTVLLKENWDGRKALLFEYLIQDNNNYYLIDIDINNSDKFQNFINSFIARKIVSTLKLN
ncbi:MAG: hypothetical protein Q8Q30_02790 [Candidatus Woesebacteria bacterium]|nr:hypothetical protein [Candidatus Woesebacteria bacterium]